MVEVTFEGRPFEVGDGQTVLEAALAAGHEIPSSCRAGACQSCLVQAASGTPPPGAQEGLAEALKAQGFFLACRARPETPLAIVRAGGVRRRLGARLVGRTALSESVLQILLEPEAPFPYRAGQFVALIRADGLARTYSLASLPEAGGPLELHVRRLPGGRMSGYLAEAPLGEWLTIEGPSGLCAYPAERPAAPLVLAGTGTGLAPLLGILRDALARGHQGSITLFHGARTEAGLYLRESLGALARGSARLSYRPCVLEGPAATGLDIGALDDVVLQSDAAVPEASYVLCGDPDLVTRLKRALFLKGAALKAILADRFEPALA